MRLPSEILAPFLIILGLFSVWLFLSISSTILPGDNWTTVSEDILPLIPLIIALVAGLTTVFHVVGRR